MKKRKNVLKGIRLFLLFIIIFLLFILLNSANWFLDNFDIEFSTALYQLFSPLKGTASDVINDYLKSCLYPSIFVSLLFLVFYNVYDDIMLKKLVLEFDIRIWKKEFSIRNAGKIIKNFVLGVVFLALCILIWNRAVSIGIPEYIQNIVNSSMLFEEEYIDPNDVSIVFPEKKRNLLLIYMESMETTYASVDDGGGKPVNYIPELTALANRNLYFSNDNDLGGARNYASAGNTTSSLLASSSGINYKLPIGLTSIGKYEVFLPGVTTIGDILDDAGYKNYFMCGSNAAFSGRLDFYTQHGNYCIYDYNSAKDDGIIPEDYHVFWGMEDLYLYEYAKQELTKIATGAEPFNFTMLTVDTHFSDGYICELCGNQYPEKYANVIACADKQISQFIDWIKEQDWYEDTTVVIAGDHLSMNIEFWDDIGDYDRRIYNCFINLPEGLHASRTANRAFSNMDMFPTILTAMGVDIEGERLGLGTNLFSDEQTLAEKMGEEAFDAELELYSNYYYSNFIIADNADE
ncbi:MAG: LTA synthase family protein [Lachnospiraceae bacterium]|nr:LTA synthase family protein [Lachnospiraceae bacterium]